MPRGVDFLKESEEQAEGEDGRRATDHNPMGMGQEAEGLGIKEADAFVEGGEGEEGCIGAKAVEGERRRPEAEAARKQEEGREGGDESVADALGKRGSEQKSREQGHEQQGKPEAGVKDDEDTRGEEKDQAAEGFLTRHPCVQAAERPEEGGETEQRAEGAV